MNGQPKVMRQSPHSPPSAPLSFSAHFETLRAAHRQTETALEEIEKISSGGVPDPTRFGTARLRLGQANLARQRITGIICRHLFAVTSPDDAQAIRQLQRRDQEQFRLTSELIGRWTPQAVEQDWTGYCDAARKVRCGISQSVAAERKLLYPLLEQRD